jgi:tetratricopeptide (TPR) repeat protein
MGLAEQGNRRWLEADDIEGLARLVARQDAGGAQLLNECWDRATRLEDIGLCSEAAYECREMLEISELPQVYRFVALEHVVFGEEERAVLIAHEGVEIDPNDAERHRALGDVYFEMERYAEAAGAFQRAVELGCGDAGLLLSLARCHELLGDHKSAAEWQGRVAAVSPRSQHTY